MADEPMMEPAMPSRATGDDRFRLLDQIVHKLAAVAPIRWPVTKKNAKRVLAVWKEWRASLYAGDGIDDAITGLWSDFWASSYGGWRFVDVACTLAEASLLVGSGDDYLAFLDAAVGDARRRPGTVRHTTSERLARLRACASADSVAIAPRGVDEAVLRALPQPKYDTIARETGHTIDSVKRSMGRLRKAKRIEGDRWQGYRRTALGDATLKSWSRGV